MRNAKFIIALLLATGLIVGAIFASYRAFNSKGVLCTAVGAFLVVVLFRRLTWSSVWPKDFAQIARFPWERTCEAARKPEVEEKRWHASPLLRSNVFVLLAAVFLLTFPYSDFVQAVGLVPGLVFIVVLAFLVRHTRGESSIPGLIGITIWLLLLWLWGEAGRQGFVVMPVDVPSGAETVEKEHIDLTTQKGAVVAEKEPRSSKVEFTGEGMANALETEIASFGSGERGNYAQSEAAQILAGPDLISRLFPTNPWYKGAFSHSPQLTGLETSHVIFNTQIHDLPLSGIYHVLRYIRGKPMIEGQVLIGDNNMTLALRRSNFELSCTSRDLNPALLAFIASKAGRPAMDDVLDLIRADQKQAKMPDGSNCERWSLAGVLSWLDLVPSPRNGEEERISNVSVANPKGDSQLTELIHFAVLEAMGTLSAERLAYYYDNAAKYESALKEYEEALPTLLIEYEKTPAWDRHAITDRVVDTLIRIGDLESELNQKEELSDGAYELAKEISDDNKVRVMARIGYHYLVLSQVATLNCITQGKLEADCLRQDDDVKKWRGRAKNEFLSASNVPGAPFYRYSGADHGRDTLTWLSANYGYVLAVEAEQPHDRKSEPSTETKEQLAHALYYGNPAKRDWEYKSQPEEELFRNTEDLRAAAAAAYGWSKGSLTGPLANAKPCPRDRTPADTAGPVCHIESLLKTTDQYTVNNMILIESQLHDFYAQVPGDLTTQMDLHESSLYLLAALREYRAGKFEKALSLIRSLKLPECRPLVPECHPLAGLQKLAEAFIQSTWQVHDPKKLWKDDPGEKPEDALNLILANNAAGPGKKNEVFWRALSLRAVRKVMCLDSDNVAPCVPEQMPDLQAAAKAASHEMPGNAYLHANFGIVLVRTGELDAPSKLPHDALREFHQAVQINPWDPWLRCLLAEAYEENGDSEESQTQLQFGRLLDPSHWKDYNNDVHAVWPNLVYRPLNEEKKGAGPKTPVEHPKS